MLNLFKIKIPKDNAQEITELKSWTISWCIRTNGYEQYNYYNKVFIKESEADEFDKQLKESAKFIKAYIRTEKTKN